MRTKRAWRVCAIVTAGCGEGDRQAPSARSRRRSAGDQPSDSHLAADTGGKAQQRPHVPVAGRVTLVLEIKGWAERQLRERRLREQLRVQTPSALNYGADTIIRRAGTNHLTPLGELRIPLSMIYSADGFGQRTITLKNAVSFTDDRGNATMIGVNASVVSHEVMPF